MKQKFLTIAAGIALAFLSACDDSTSSNSVVIETVLTDSRDGQVYDIVKIGNQTWMAKNLNYKILEKTGDNLRNDCYKNLEGNCQLYGRLYTWSEAKKICPQGWHLPDTTEWNTLFNFVGGRAVAGQKLKAEVNLWTSSGYGTDEFGFSALPGGFHKASSQFFDIGQYANFWTSNEDNESQAYHVTLFYDQSVASHITDSKNYGLSVRCLKD